MRGFWDHSTTKAVGTDLSWAFKSLFAIVFIFLSVPAAAETTTKNASSSEVLIWLRDGNTQPAEDALEILENSWSHGLNPAHYRIAIIRQKLKTLAFGNALEVDLDITAEAIKYVSDLSRKRSDDKLNGLLVGVRNSELDLQVVRGQFANSRNPVEILHSFAPSGHLYNALRNELIRLKNSPRKTFIPIEIEKPLKPHQLSSQIPAIRARLGLAPSIKDPDFYDDQLAREIIKLQKQNGLEGHGITGPETLRLFNRNRFDDIKQIIVNMERLRWIGEARPARYVIVNIPSATLWAVEGGATKFTMPVTVGKTARPTYSFRSEATGVRFNPPWTVPPTIKREDFLPALQADAGSLRSRGIAMSIDGEVIDPAEIDWSNLSSADLQNVAMVQAPGPGNPLGVLRVVMQNPYDIYLHASSRSNEFEQTDRALSSGCIRVAEPIRLADFLLSGNEDWTPEKRQMLIETGRTHEVRLRNAVPIFITYQTIWLDAAGRLVFGRDIYGQDQALFKALEKTGAVDLSIFR